MILLRVEKKDPLSLLYRQILTATATASALNRDPYNTSIQVHNTTGSRFFHLNSECEP